MHGHSIKSWQHEHIFLGKDHERNERRTWFVIALTATMMIVEIVAGSIFGSMALLADGFHMATHAGALTITALAYYFSRRHAQDARFSFGTGKLGDLAGFASAITLAIIALIIGYESLVRLANPVSIKFDAAISVAVIGLIVNLVSAALLHSEGHHHHDHHHDDHGHAHDHRDHNLRSAYFHVLADALTSVLAIVALAVGWVYGWIFMDPLMGIVGALVIARWSWGLIRDTGAILLDTVPDQKLASDIHQILETKGDRVSDLHLWRVGPGHLAAIVSIVSDNSLEPDEYKDKLTGYLQLSHITVEVQPCRSNKRTT